MMGVVEDQGRLAAQHATEYAPPTHITRAGRSAQVLAGIEVRRRGRWMKSRWWLFKVSRRSGCRPCLDRLKRRRAPVVPDLLRWRRMEAPPVRSPKGPFLGRWERA